MCFAFARLARAGIAMGTGTFLVAVALPIALTALMATIVFAIIMGARAIRFRESMNRLAQLDFRVPPEGTALDLRDDLLGVRAAFRSMREQLDRAMARLAHADSQRRRLFADLAHELATPISVLLGLSDTLTAPGLARDVAERERFLGLMNDEIARLARLVEDVRDLAELDDPDVSFVGERAELAPIVQRVVDRFAVSDGARVAFRGEHAPASVDVQRVEQVVTNLFSNAHRHTPVEGTIAVVVALEDGRAVLRVEDSGPGVPEDQLARLGERLFRADPSRDRRGGGHGLGLSIVCAIARRQAGTVTFDIGPLGGLRVTVSWPAADP